MTLIVLATLGALAIFVVWVYNRLVRLRNGTENAWSDIDVQLKRRYELIPNLVETVKGYALHEKSTLEEVTRARTAAMAATTLSAKSAAEGQLSGVLKTLFAVAEAYPELKANQNFLELQTELVRIEDAIQNARRYYNAVVRDLNTATEVFPSNLVANGFGFTRKEYFELDSGAERAAPQIDLAS